jgi:two-component system, sensor histidine kinase and response regulator
MSDNPTPATIMVVDDDPANLDLLVSILSQQGYRVLSFTRGDSALRAVTLVAPDLILLDVNMPGMSGLEVCARLKAEPASRAIPVIFISVMSETSDKVEAFQVGGVDYVTKPFRVEEVLARIATHLRLQTLQRELQQNYAALKRVEELRETLVQMIIHDLRGPLTTASAYTDLLLHDPAALPPASRPALQAARSALQGLSDMVNALLDVTQLEEGSFPLQLEPCDLGSVIREAVRLVTDPTRQLTLRTELPETLPTVQCDRDIVRRITGNLVGNAVKYTPDGGTITISCAAGPDDVRIQVTDTGLGIPQEYRERIFEKFGQVLGRRTGLRRSPGLGLTFCKLATEAHGGRIGVESVEGTGSTFWFTLPIRPGTRPRAPAGAPPAAAG